MRSRPHVIALFGPTGVGKTAIAVSLARRLRARGERPVAISADALQVYQGLETLTGVATASEQAELEHRLISFLPLDASFSAGQYAELAHAQIDAALAEDRRPIVVGGTGLYLRAALTELDLRPPPAEGVRERWTTELELHGAPALHARLARRAPWVAEGIDPNDRQRIVRSMELLDAGELPHPGGPSGSQADHHSGSQADDQPDGPSQLWTEEVRRPTLLVGLVMERDELYGRIDVRVDEMLTMGAREEVLHAHAAGASPTARKALGFEELLSGDIEAMKRRTRNYTRRQLTWMRKLSGVHVVDVTGRTPEAIAAEIVESLSELERPPLEPEECSEPDGPSELEEPETRDA
jgi:tRNA dimethylallyltransferase